uniref:Uncharacterized protein n=1 Tax=Tanacetum cinerariifolium TaxID=118510 RepID=A0A699GMD9_TANCI|nr:hypothetical protein [Tanacetum cinerariifolium]
MREMYLILNPIEREELETKMRSKDALATTEVEYGNYKTEMEEFKTKLMKKEKIISSFKAVVVVLIAAFGVVLDYESMVWILKTSKESNQMPYQISKGSGGALSFFFLLGLASST